MWRQAKIIGKAIDEGYAEGCEGNWVKNAQEALSFIEISLSEFSQTIQTNLLEGRGEHRNIMPIVLTNCAKTFMLKPLIRCLEIKS